jgi:hypothetical protein
MKGELTCMVRMFVGGHSTRTLMAGLEDSQATSQGDPPESEIKVS